MKLSSWRKDNSITQKQVAAVIGVDTTMISKYERALAKPTLYHLALIHKLTNNQVTVEDFLYADEKAAVAENNCRPSENPVSSGTCSACSRRGPSLHS